MASNTSNFPATFDWSHVQQIYLEVVQTSQDFSANTTTFSYALYIRGAGAGAGGSTTSGSYSITGAVSASASAQSWSWSDVSPRLIKSGTFTKTHDSSGNLSAQTVSASVTIVGYNSTYGDYRSATTSVSVTISATPIPVANTALLGNSSGVSQRGVVHFGNASDITVVAKEVYIGNASDVPVKAKY